MFRTRKQYLVAAILFVSITMVALFQNCGQNINFSTIPSSSLTSTGTTPPSTPITPTTPVTKTSISFVQVTTSTEANCGITADGLAYCWGNNQLDMVGNGTNGTPSSMLLTPTAVAQPAGSFFTKIVSTIAEVCALDKTGIVYCWGYANSSTLGDGKTGLSPIPIAVKQPNGVIFTDLLARDSVFCAATAAKKNYCWGMTQMYDLYPSSMITTDGPNTLGYFLNVPSLSTIIPTSYSQFLYGNGLVCTLQPSGELLCANRGYFTFADQTTHYNTFGDLAIPSGITFTQIAGDNVTLCGLATTGQVYCAGENQYGQLGNSTLPFDTVDASGISYVFVTKTFMPVDQPGGIKFSQITSSLIGYFCGLTADGEAYCWGGEKPANADSKSSPAKALGVPSGVKFTQIAPVYGSGCGLTSDGQAYCWGANSFGNLGNGTTTDSVSMAVPVSQTF